MPESQLIVAAMLNLSNFHPLLKSKVAHGAANTKNSPLNDSSYF